MDKKAKFTLTFTLGAATGATMALLLAPQPGTETRQKLAMWTGTTRGKLKEFSHTTAEKVKVAGHWMKGAASTMSEKAHSLASFVTKRRRYQPTEPTETVQMVEQMEEAAPLPVSDAI